MKHLISLVFLFLFSYSFAAKDYAKILRDENKPLLEREEAALQIGKQELRKLAPALVQGAQHKSLLIRKASLQSLMHFRARTGLPVYIEIATQDPVLALRQEATLAMGLLRWEKAIPPLVKLTDDPKEEIRGAACLAMAAIHSQKNDFREILKEMTQDKSLYVQEKARKGLDITSRKNKTIQSHLRSSDPDVRLFGSLYFHYHGKPSDLPPIQTAKKKEKNEQVKYEMSLAIKGIKKRVSKQKPKKKKSTKN